MPSTAGLRKRSSANNASTSALSWSSGTTRVASPNCCASRAEIVRPVRIRSSAACGPTKRGSITIATGGKQPSLISGWPNCADSAATTKSQKVASSQPPPKQSEERRVGKEGRAREPPAHEQRKSCDRERADGQNKTIRSRKSRVYGQ